MITSPSRHITRAALHALAASETLALQSQRIAGPFSKSFHAIIRAAHV